MKIASSYTLRKGEFPKAAFDVTSREARLQAIHVQQLPENFLTVSK